MKLGLVLVLGMTFFSVSNSGAEVQAVNSVRAVDISVGGETSRGYGCVILLSHEVLCWGDNAPIRGIVPGINDAVGIAAGVGHTCVALRTKTVKCWGSNGNGQLGNGTQNSSTTPVTVIGVGGNGVLSNIVEVAASAKYDFTCALSSAGNVMCWGSNSHGGIGNPSVSMYSSTDTPVNVIELSTSNPLTDVKTIAVGSYATCAVKVSGAAFCWGDNGLGQLGNPTTGSTNAAVPVFGVGGTGNLTDATQVALGDAMGCARRSNGAVACWGMNFLGNGTAGGSNSPVAVLGVSTAVQVVTAEENACVLLVSGEVKCWGNWHGNPGSGASQQIFSQSTSPSGAALLTNARQLATGGGWPQKYCAILNDDTVRCWGANDSGSLGVDSGAVQYSNVPVEPQLSFTMGPVTTTSTTTSTTTTSTTTSVPAAIPTTATTVPTTVVAPVVTNVGNGASTNVGSTTIPQGQKSVPRVAQTVPTAASTTVPVATESLERAKTGSQPPLPAEVETGQGSYSANGKVQKLEVSRNSNQVVMNAGQQKVVIGLLDSNGKRVALNDEGNLDLSIAAFIDVDLDGFAPGEGCSIWIYSTASKLGESVVDSAGRVSGRFSIPAAIETGSHRIVVSVGPKPESSQRFTLGVVNSEVSRSSVLSRVLIIAPITIAVIVGLLIPNQQRRRRRKLMS